MYLKKKVHRFTLTVDRKNINHELEYNTQYAAQLTRKEELQTDSREQHTCDVMTSHVSQQSVTVPFSESKI